MVCNHEYVEDSNDSGPVRRALWFQGVLAVSRQCSKHVNLYQSSPAYTIPIARLWTCGILHKVFAIGDFRNLNYYIFGEGNNDPEFNSSAYA